jgi:ribonuclease P protein component
VVHLDIDAGVDQPQVGLVVGRTVGPAVTRNLVKRRLRHLSRDRVSSLPGSAVLVVRALPPAADATYAALGADLDRAVGRLLRQYADSAGAGRDLTGVSGGDVTS